MRLRRCARCTVLAPRRRASLTSAPGACRRDCCVPRAGLWGIGTLGLEPALWHSLLRSPVGTFDRWPVKHTRQFAFDYSFQHLSSTSGGLPLTHKQQTHRTSLTPRTTQTTPNHPTRREESVRIMEMVPTENTNTFGISFKWPSYARVPCDSMRDNIRVDAQTMN